MLTRNESNKKTITRTCDVETDNSADIEQMTCVGAAGREGALALLLPRNLP